MSRITVCFLISIALAGLAAPLPSPGAGGIGDELTREPNGGQATQLSNVTTNDSRVAAIVNGKPILESEVRAACQMARRHYAGRPDKLREAWTNELDNLINRRLVIMDFDKRGLKIPKEEIDKAMAQDDSPAHDSEWFRERMIVAKMLQQMVAEVPRPTPKDFEDYYKTHQKEFWEEEKVNLDVIDFKVDVDSEAVRKQAAAVRAHLAAGKEFPSEAKLNQQGNGAKVKVRQTWYDLSALRPELAKAVSSLQPGQFSDVIEFSDDICLIQLLERKAAHQPALNEVYDSVSRKVNAERRAAAERGWHDSLRKQAVIQVFPPPVHL